MQTVKALNIPETVLLQLADGQVEEMPVEEYLKGVVPSEMGLQKPVEALKAQAIAARSFAVTTRRHAREGFDLCTTTHCQVWKPKNRYPDSDRAVDETAGQVATLSNRIVATPYFGHCDGRTRNSEEVWSGIMKHCRSVSCICGYTAMHGHGVGMCQRGAAAMAQQGANHGEILKHYYKGIKIEQAASIPRSEFRTSLVLGRVVDGDGKPLSGFRLLLKGSAGRVDKGTTKDGRFWFSNLPSGQWDLRVKGKPVYYRDLTTDGRNTLELQVVVPDAPPLHLHAMPMAYPQQLLGTLGFSGIQVTVEDSEGNTTRVLSGSRPDFDPGGFSLPLPSVGACKLSFLERSYDLQIGERGLWVRFLEQTG